MPEAEAVTMLVLQRATARPTKSMAETMSLIDDASRTLARAKLRKSPVLSNDELKTVLSTLDLTRGEITTEHAQALFAKANWDAGAQARLATHVDNYLTTKLPFNALQVREALRELDGFVGLDSVRAQIPAKAIALRYDAQRRALGLPSDRKETNHMVFLGNPGTGKTTVARVIAKLMNAMGVTKSDKFVETDALKLAGKVVGEAQTNTRKAFDEAEGGVLFIDEAYAVAQDYGHGKNPYGKEVIDTLLTEAENRRDRVTVIVAGYRDEMGEFFAANSGMRSRFPKDNEFTFESYTNAQMLEIIRRDLAREQYVFGEGAEAAALAAIAALPRDKTFGNGREARNLVDSWLKRLKARVIDSGENTKRSFTTVAVSDIVPERTSNPRRSLATTNALEPHVEEILQNRAPTPVLHLDGVRASRETGLDNIESGTRAVAVGDGYVYLNQFGTLNWARSDGAIRQLHDSKAMSAISGEGDMVVGSLTESIHVWRWNEGKPLRRSFDHPAAISTTVHPDTNRLAAVTRDNKLIISEMHQVGAQPRLRILRELEVKPGQVASPLSFSPNGDVLFFSNGDTLVRLNVEDNSITSVPFACATALGVDPLGRFVVVTHALGDVTLLDAQTLQTVSDRGTLLVSPHQVSFSPDGRHYAAASNDRVTIHAVDESQPSRELTASAVHWTSADSWSVVAWPSANNAVIKHFH